jgi:hypothetical protein
MSLQSPIDQCQRVVLDRFGRPFTAEASGASLNVVSLECVARDTSGEILVLSCSWGLR